MSEPLHIKISLEEANLILSALGNLPYIQVHQIILSLQNQIGPQLVEIDKKSKQSVNGKVINTPVT